MKAAAVFLLVLYLAVNHAWKCREGPRLNHVHQIDSGSGQVVATTKYGRPHQLSGKTWYRLGTSNLKHVSVGPAGTWGCDSRKKVYKLVAGNWKQIKGESLHQVDAGGDGQVVGVATRGYSCCLKDHVACSFYGVGSVSWIRLANKMKYISCGKKYGCWAVNKLNEIYVTKKINPSTCANQKWKKVLGPKMKMIEVSCDGKVFGVGTNGKVYQRISITKPNGKGNPNKPGNYWKPIPMCMPISHLTYDLHHLWVVTTSGWLLQCTH